MTLCRRRLQFLLITYELQRTSASALETVLQRQFWQYSLETNQMMHQNTINVQLYFVSHSPLENCLSQQLLPVSSCLLAVTRLCCHPSAVLNSTVAQQLQVAKKEHEEFTKTDEDYHIIQNSSMKAKEGKMFSSFFVFSFCNYVSPALCFFFLISFSCPSPFFFYLVKRGYLAFCCSIILQNSEMEKTCLNNWAHFSFFNSTINFKHIL